MLLVHHVGMSGASALKHCHQVMGMWEDTKFCLPLAFQRALLSFLLLFPSAANAGDVFRGGHSQEVLFHYPRCCAFWAERGRSPHRDVPGPPAVPELKSPMFVTTTTTTSQSLVQLWRDSFFISVEQSLSFSIKVLSV